MPRRDSCSRSRHRITVSSAHQEIERRLARSPRALAEELARVYGREFTQPNYIAAMAVVSRLRLGERDDVARLLAPYLDGAKDSFARPSQSSLAAHLLFFEYARRTGDDRAKALVLRAAASGFTENGELREFMPLHGGWSDSLFMDVPILAMAGALTGERRYFDMAARHVAFMQQIVLQAGRSLSSPGVGRRRMGARQCVRGARPGADPVGVPAGSSGRIRVCWRRSARTWRRSRASRTRTGCGATSSIGRAPIRNTRRPR